MRIGTSLAEPGGPQALSTLRDGPDADEARRIVTAAEYSAGMAVTQSQVSSIKEDVRALGDTVSEVLLRVVAHDTRFDLVDRRFDGVDARFDRVEARLDAVETRLDRVEARLDAMEARLDRVEARLDRVETRLDGIDSRLGEISSTLHEILTLVRERR
ncbi:MAG TPA: hypothetical protein VNF47_26900 [Streptosporangiaceae bacterium]|nr:hypothetical protein [Streptosporangiaceae bacterium]